MCWDSLLEQIFNHISQLVISFDKIIELLLWILRACNSWLTVCSRHLLFQLLDLFVENVKTSMLDLVHILLELLIFCLDLVILGQIFNLTSFEPQHIHVNFLNLV